MEKKNKYLISSGRWKYRYVRPRRKKRIRLDALRIIRKNKIERKLIKQKFVDSSLKKRWFEKSLLKKKLEKEPFLFTQQLVPLTFLKKYKLFLGALGKRVDIEVIVQNYFLKNYFNHSFWFLYSNNFKLFFRPLMEQKVLSFFIKQIGLTLVRYRKSIFMKKRLILLKKSQKKKRIFSEKKVLKAIRDVLDPKKEKSKKKKKVLSSFIDKSISLVNHWITFKVTQNNSFITVIDKEGEVLLWHSSGQSGFKGPRRSTPYASRMTGIAFFKKLVKSLRKELLGYGKGKKKYPPIVFGFLMKSGRKRKVKMLLKGFFEMMKRTRLNRRAGRIPNIKIKCIMIKQRFSHNGLRKKKKRRL
jgi:ribosomal protein S11